MERFGRTNQWCCSIPAARSSISTCSVTERHAKRLCRNEQIEIHGHGLHLAHHLGKRLRDDVRRVECHHGAKLTLAHEIDGLAAEASRQYPIEAGGRAPSLQVAEYDRSCFLACECAER